MKSKNINFILKIALLPLILYSALIGCAGRLPEAEIQHISKYKTFQSQNGVSVAIDAFFEEERLQKFFGTDILSTFDILPVHIIIENNIGQPILIQKENILLLNADNDIIQKPSTDPAQAVEKRKHAVKAIGGGGLLWQLAANMLERVEINIKTKAFYEKVIDNKGELHHGFVYFILNDLAVLSNNVKIQVMAKNINTEATTTFVFDVDMGAIKGEIKRRKDEESKRGF